MKAITLSDFGGPEMMQYSEIETPTPGAGQILIRVHATSVNRPDVIQRQGLDRIHARFQFLGAPGTGGGVRAVDSTDRR